MTGDWPGNPWAVRAFAAMRKDCPAGAGKCIGKLKIVVTDGWPAKGVCELCPKRWHVGERKIARAPDAPRRPGDAQS